MTGTNMRLAAVFALAVAAYGQTSRGTLTGTRDNMIHGEVHHFGLLRQAAVFAAIPRAIRYLPVQTRTHTSHDQRSNSGNASVSRLSATSDFTFCSERS